MGVIVKSDNLEEFYHADCGYAVPVTPKTRYRYNSKKREHEKTDDYTLAQLEHAEQKYLMLKDKLKENYGDAFIVEQKNSYSRIAIVVPACMLGVSSKPLEMLRGNDFFTLSLQSGTVFNLPSNKLNKMFNSEIVVPNSKGGGNNGNTVDEALKFMYDVRQMFTDRFEKIGVHHVNDYMFQTLVAAYIVSAAGVIVQDPEGWMEYVKHGKDIESIFFGFNRAVFSRVGIPPIPVEHVDEYRELPIEWVQHILRKDK